MFRSRGEAVQPAARDFGSQHSRSVLKRWQRFVAIGVAVVFVASACDRPRSGSDAQPRPDQRSAETAAEGSALTFKWSETSSGASAPASLPSKWAFTLELVETTEDVELVSVKPLSTRGDIRILDSRVIVFNSPTGEGIGTAPGLACAQSVDGHFRHADWNFPANGYLARAGTSLFLVFYAEPVSGEEWSVGGVDVTYRLGSTLYRQVSEGVDVELTLQSASSC